MKNKLELWNAKLLQVNAVRKKIKWRKFRGVVPWNHKFVK